MTDSDDDLLRFIAASFPSVWALELLLALKGARGPVAREELVTTLRASELVISKALDALVAAGLATVDGNEARYLPVNRVAELYVDRVEELYRSRPNAVRRVIVAASTSRASAFADAFKLRRDRDE